LNVMDMVRARCSWCSSVRWGVGWDRRQQWRRHRRRASESACSSAPYCRRPWWAQLGALERSCPRGNAAQRGAMRRGQPRPTGL